MKYGLCFILAQLAVQAPGGGAAADMGSSNYALFLIKTDLQRYLLFSTSADAYAQFDVATCVEGEKFDSRRVRDERFRVALAELARQTGKTKPSLYLSFRYAGVSPSPAETKLMEDAVKAVCRQAGFAAVRTGMSYEGGTWKERTEQLAGLADDINPSETAVEDEFVRIYPVRTRLSRFLLGTKHDCFIELRQLIDGRFKGFSPAARQALGLRVAKLHLERKRAVTFRCLASTEGEKSFERFFQNRQGQASPADELVKELGFQSGDYSMVPMRVSPEELLGKKAPDFTLDELRGGRLHLDEVIRGRVAVISFWGVACGACREEATHLTALYDRYRSKGLVVVAVNGYDEGKDVVERFAREKGLTHPICLMGSKIAEKYTVASYPVTYLVDRTGTIVDYHLGFETGEEALLGAAITRLLSARDEARGPGRALPDAAPDTRTKR